MATTGPATPHRHKTKSGYWYDREDEPKHTHTVPDPPEHGHVEFDLLQLAIDELTERVRLLETAAPAPESTNDQGALPYGGA